MEIKRIDSLFEAVDPGSTKPTKDCSKSDVKYRFSIDMASLKSE
jgi:hypothetical protein